MEQFKYFKTFEKDGIANGATYEDDWTADEDLVIKRVYIKNKSGAELNKSTFYFKVSENVYTHPVVPVSIVGENILVSPILDIPFKKGQKLAFTFKNLEGTDVDVFICFEVHSLTTTTA